MNADSNYMWKLNEEVLSLCKKLELELVRYKCHLALGGSLLYRGYSYKDLDLFVYAHNPGDMNRMDYINNILVAFSNIGITLETPWHPSIYTSRRIVLQGNLPEKDSKGRFRHIDVFVLIGEPT